MNKLKTIYWIPRVLAIGFIIFLSLFAFDSFGTGETWYMEIVGFLVHLLPNYLLIGALIIAWRNERVGGILFLLLYVIAIFFFRAGLIGLVLFSPLVIIGILFLLQLKFNRRI